VGDGRGRRKASASSAPQGRLAAVQGGGGRGCGGARAQAPRAGMHPGGPMNPAGAMGGFPPAPPTQAAHMHPQMQAQMAAMQQQQQGPPMPMHGMMPLGPAAMPAQHSQGQVFEFLPGVASLVEDLDKRVLVTLRDGRHFVGESPPAVSGAPVCGLPCCRGSRPRSRSRRHAPAPAERAAHARGWAGMMRSFDQYGNVMLEDTFERHVVGNVYADERVRPCPVHVLACCAPATRAGRPRRRLLASGPGVDACTFNASALTGAGIRWGCT